jgi:hypothetical protein
MGCLTYFATFAIQELFVIFVLLQKERETANAYTVPHVLRWGVVPRSHTHVQDAACHLVVFLLCGRHGATWSCSARPDRVMGTVAHATTPAPSRRQVPHGGGGRDGSACPTPHLVAAADHIARAAAGLEA